MQRAEEQKQRIAIWFEELPKYVFTSLEDVKFHGWFTKERLSYEEAKEHQFLPMPQGTPWGAKWEYGWFKAEITLPEEAEGKRIYLHPDVGGEMLVWVNGQIVGSRDLQHDGVTLTRCGHKGDRYEIVVESYAGHGPRLENGGPCPPERIAVPEPPECQVSVGKCDFGIWNEDAFQLMADVYTLKQLYQGLEPKSLRAMKVREGLVKFTEIVDYELSPEERNETFCQARAVLKPLLECNNGSTAPVFSIIGQSHLDLAWKWTWEETRRKCARTISNQLALSDEYEDYKFLLCEPPIMENLKENYPELYERTKEKVKTGAFVPEGGVYVESDTNLVSGESLIRQCIYGRKWYKEELGVDSVMVWLPDCFGFSGQLPQIMVKSGMKYFATQKLARALKGCDVFPFNTFTWKGIDGTGILANFHRENNAKLEPLDMIKRWNEDRVQQENIDTFLYPFGYGDGGGGATRTMVEIANRVGDLEGAPRTRMESPIAFFEELEKKGLPEETYEGELYLPWHRGTYTSQAQIKADNRRTEESVREAELWNSISGFLDCNASDQKEMEAVWKKLLFNQFHDILPGTSITRVCEEAIRDLKEVREAAGVIGTEACKSLLEKTGGLHKKDGFVIFNSLSWDRTDLILIPEELGDCWQQNGQVLPVQKTAEGVLVSVTAPACGYSVIERADSSKMMSEGKIDTISEGKANTISEEKSCSIFMENGMYVMENQYIKATIDNLGQVISLTEKESQIQYMAEAGNQLCMYKDVNVDYDAWEMSTFYDKFPVELEEKAEVTIVEEGPLEVKLLVKRMLHKSLAEQEIILKHDSPRIDFKTRIDWNETHKLLKAVFPFRIHTEEAIHEIPFGYINRPTHRNRQYDMDRFEVCNRHYTALTEPGRTAAVLNDSKYGVSARGNRIELTLLKAPVWPDMYADQGIHEFTYSLYVSAEDFHNSGTIQEGYELNHKLLVAEGGNGTEDYAFFEVSHKKVILETVKLAEDGSGDLILRLYESTGSHVTANIGTSLEFCGIWEVTMEEGLENGTEIFTKECGNKPVFQLEFQPFEIKTIRISKENRKEINE